MISLDTNLTDMAATTQVAKATEMEQRKEQQASTAADVLGAAVDGIDVARLAVEGCKAAAKAMQPSHMTGGKEPASQFMTGGGDGTANSFQTVADCMPTVDATDAAAQSAGIVADAAGVVGDVLSGTADVVGGIIGGIFDGL
jgi:hypothetical protein